MISTRLNALALAALLSLGQGAAIATEGGSKTVATVNGQAITQEMLDVYTQQRTRRMPPGAPQPSRQAMVEELVNMELVKQDAEKRKIDQLPEVQRELAWHRRGVLVSKAMRDYLEKHPITEAELKTAYDEEVKKLGGTEYHARHILLENEADAKAVIKALDGGADFAELAKEKSTGPTGKNGGDLGWFSPKQMVKPFADAVAAMKPGSYSKQPVKTQFGWHVIKLEETRPMQPPAFDQVKPQLKTRLQNDRIEDYLNALKKSARIEIKD